MGFFSNLFSRVKDIVKSRGETINNFGEEAASEEAQAVETESLAEHNDRVIEDFNRWYTEQNAQYILNERDGEAVINNFMIKLENLSQEAQSIPKHENANKLTYSGIAEGLANSIDDLASRYGAGIVGGALEKAKKEGVLDPDTNMYYWMFYNTKNEDINNAQDKTESDYERFIEATTQTLNGVKQRMEQEEAARRERDLQQRERAQEQARHAAETARKYAESGEQKTTRRGLFSWFRR